MEARGNRLVAIVEQQVIKGLHGILFVSGEKEGSILSLDLQTVDLEEQSAEDGQVFVQSRWIAVDAEKRVVAVEVNRPTVGIDDVRFLLEELAKEYSKSNNVEIELNLAINPKFIDEVERFTRIREASITLSRPNSDWTDVANRWVEDMQSSGVKDLDLAARASRGQSLDKSSGLISLIKDVARAPHSFVKNMRVTGNVKGMEKEQTASLKRNKVTSVARLDLQKNRDEQLVDLFPAMKQVTSVSSPELNAAEEL